MSDSALIFIPQNEENEESVSVFDDTDTENPPNQRNDIIPLHKTILCKKRNCKYFKYETNAKNREKIKANLLNQLERVIKEYYERVNGDAVVVAMSDEFASNFHIVGTYRLRTIVKDFVTDIQKNISTAMETNDYQEDDPLDNTATADTNVNLFPLPPLRVNDTPITLNKMTQAHLRAFIPLMLKYSLGRGKPGWGKKELRPVWWPKDVPWANIRTDIRSPEEKMKISWSCTLRRIVKCCYEYHGRLDLIDDIELMNPYQSDADKLNLNEEPTNISVMTPDGPITLYCTVVSVADDYSVLPDNNQIENNEEATE